MIYFMLAAGLSIVFGLLRFVNFAHGAFYMLGAYFAYWIVEHSHNFWIALFVAPLIVALLAWVAERFVLRHMYKLEHGFHILFTLGLAWVLQELVISAWGPVGFNMPIPNGLQGVFILGDIIVPVYRLFIIGFGIVVAIALWLLLERTRLGNVIRAGSERPDVVMLLRINVYRYFGIAFALGAGVAALAGALVAPIRGVEPFMQWEALLVAFVVVVVGGLGSFSGALVGGILIGVVQSLMSAIWPVAANVTIYVAMLVVLLLRPNGIMGRAQ